MTLAWCAAWRERAGAAHAGLHIHAVEHMKNPVAGFLENPEKGQSETDSDTLYYLTGNLHSGELFED